MSGVVRHEATVTSSEAERALFQDVGVPFSFEPVGEDAASARLRMVVAPAVAIIMGAVVLDGAVIEDQVMVAAGSLVSPGKTLESGGLYLGNPAKRVRDLNEKELAFFRESADHYVRLKDEHLSESAPLDGQ